MKKCVWYVSKYVIPPNAGSAGGRGYFLMKELAQAGFQVAIITSDSNHLGETPILDQPYMHEFIDRMDLWWVRTLKYKAAKSLRRILSWLDFEWRLYRMPTKNLPQPDAIVVSSLSLLTILNGFLWRKHYGCHLTFEVRDIWPLTLTEEGGFTSRNLFIKFLGFIERLGYEYADEVVGTMPNLSEHVSNVLGRKRSVSCIPMGIEESAVLEAPPLPPEYVCSYIPNNKFIVGHVGSIGISNALDSFLEAAAQLRDRNDIHFLLVGDGDLKKGYQSRYGDLPNITFAPKVEKVLVQSVLGHCDLLYFSTHVSEVWKYGQSLNKVIDYMLSGKPILASYSGYPSMINEADCGRFVPSGDTESLREEIVRFADMNPEARVDIGARGRKWIQLNRRYKTLAADYVDILFPSLK